MSTTFMSNHEKLLSLLPSCPTKDEMDSLLRITPQGMSKINADIIRGTSNKIILSELVDALRSINKILNRTYNELELLPDRRTTIEENEALEWAIQSHPTVLNTMIQNRDVTDVLNELIWDFRINKLSLESERLRRHGNPVYISPLVATTLVDSTDYIALRTIQLSNRQHVCINPLYLWFDFEFTPQPSHYRLCSLPSMIAEDIASSPSCSSTLERSSFCTEDEGRCSIGVPRKSFHVRFVEGICPSPTSGLRRNGVSDECPSNDLPVLTGSVQAEVFLGSISLSSLSSEVSSPKQHKLGILSKINHWFANKKKRKKI